jgi:hypothetical protein
MKDVVEAVVLITMMAPDPVERPASPSGQDAVISTKPEPKLNPELLMQGFAGGLKKFKSLRRCER